jgi:hypothetical protein
VASRSCDRPAIPSFINDLLLCPAGRSTMRPKRYWALVSQMRHKLRRALESVGVEFIDENGGGPGVRLRKR